jgi:serine/threonine protein kinase
MAPEVHEGNRYTFAADIWSLGCILYQLVTGESAFYSLDSVKLKQKVKNLDYKHLPQSTTDEVREIVEGCLIVNPDERITI